MKYAENDIYTGPLLSCYMEPMYHPACMGCVDRYECYGEEDYLIFRKKAIIMSELLDNPDCLEPENSRHIAVSLGIEDTVNIIQKILTGGHCPDGKIWSIMKLSLGKPQ